MSNEKYNDAMIIKQRLDEWHHDITFRFLDCAWGIANDKPINPFELIRINEALNMYAAQLKLAQDMIGNFMGGSYDEGNQ